MFKYTDVPAFAAKYHQGDRTAAVEALNSQRAEREVRAQQCVCRREAHYRLVGRGAGAQATPLRHGRVRCLAGWATAAKVVRNAGPLLKYLFNPKIVEPHSRHKSAPAETAARRYLQASEFGTDVSGQFFASAQGKFSGPIVAQRHPHLHDRASQEAAWQAVVKVSGVDLSYPASLSAVEGAPSREILVTNQHAIAELHDRPRGLTAF